MGRTINVVDLLTSSVAKVKNVVTKSAARLHEVLHVYIVVNIRGPID